MYKQYLKQAWQLMKQNRFFSAIYIIGTGLAISMVMVMAVVYHISTANIAPETNRDRMYYLDGAIYTYPDNGGSSSSSLGPQLLKETILEMKTPEAVAITTNPFMFSTVGDCFVQLPGGDESHKVELKGCNDSFWRVYDFGFTAGSPFTEADFHSGVQRAVISETLARQLFGRTDVAGQELLLNEVAYTLSGVVRDVSRLTSDVYGQMWVPYTTLPALMGNPAEEETQAIGELQANILLRSPADTAAFKRELAGALKRYNSMLAGGQLTLSEGQLYGERAVQELFYMDAEKTFLVLGLLLALFLLVPALNLSGLNASHMQDRIPELGVRKAFGAGRSVLFYQIIVENMMLMLPGGLAGLLFSYVLIFMLKGLLLSGGIYAIATGATTDIHLTPGLLINFEVFGYAFLICLVLNLLSSMIPVWHAVRVNITEALGGK